MVAKSVTRRRSFYWDGLEGIFPDLAELLSFTEAEVWFPFVALADDVTPDTIEIAMRAGGARTRPLDGTRFAERLWECGVLVPSDVSGASGTTVRRLVEPVRNGLLSAIQATYRGLGQPTRMMLDVGLALRPETAHVQLALWARDLGAWSELAQLWNDYWPEFWGPGRRAVTRAYANIPLPVLKTHPNLAYTDAIFRARPGDGGAESRRYLERDGMLAEATWQSLADPDAALAGATLSIGAINRRGDFAHAAEIVALATKHVQLQGGGRASKAVGKMLTPATVANFSIHAATTSLLNGELRKALLYTDQALMFSEGSLGHAGPVAAGIQTLIFAIEGDRRRYQLAQGVFRERDLPGMPGRRLIHLPVRLAEAMTAIRMLDREAAEVALGDIHPEIENSELWFVYEWLRAKMEDFWGDPVIGLAHLDAAAAVHSAALDNAGLPRSLVRRARSELLLAMRQANKAVRGINGLEHGKIPRELLVALCRAFLAAGEGRQAAIVAETGIDDPRITLVDRLQLLVIKAAGQLQAGSSTEVVAEVVSSACKMAVETGVLSAFVSLPETLRAQLLALHAARPCPVEGCLLCVDEYRDRVNGARCIPESAAVIILSRREKVLLPYLATGATLVDIAKQLSVSVHTIRKQLATLRIKLDAHDRKTLIENAQEWGLLTTEAP